MAKIFHIGNGGDPNITSGFKNINSRNVYPVTLVATAAGAALSPALILNYDFFNVDQTDGDTNLLILPDAAAGTCIDLYAVDTFKVKAGADASGLTINGGADTASITVTEGQVVSLKKADSTNWILGAGDVSASTGTGDFVLDDTPTITSPTITGATLVTPALGVASATSINKVAITAPASGSTLTIADGKTLTASASVTIAGTDATTLTVSTSQTLGNGSVQFADVSITNAEMLALRGTPKELVAAPAAGYMIDFIDALIAFDYTAAYTESADNMAILRGAAGVATSETIESTGFVDATADVAIKVSPVANVVRTKAQVDAKSLVLHNTGDGEFGGGNAANVVRVRVAYRIIPLGW